MHKTTTTRAKADKTATPQSQSTKKSRDAKLVQKTSSSLDGKQPAMHGRSKLRDEKTPDHKFDSSTTDQDNEHVRGYQTQDGAWDYGQMADHQPSSGPGSYLTKQELGVMPEDGIALSGQPQPLAGKMTTISPIRKGQWAHTAMTSPQITPA
jgi:hypothetical protein